MTSVDKNAKQMEFLYFVGGNAKWHTHVENSLEVFCKVKYI